MKVLIVGARGMLGTALRAAFANEEVTAWDRDELDITNAEQVTKKVTELKPAVIINAAAYTDVDGAETNRDLAFAINEGGVKNLAQVAKDIDVKLIHYSTDYVFSGTKEDGYAENDQAGPAINVYGESKLAGERAIQNINPNYFILRTAWLYGPNGKNFVETMLALAQNHAELTVVNDQFGSPTYTKDLAQVTREFVNGSYPPGIYHATNRGQASWYEFAKEIFRRAGVAVNVKPVSSSEYPRPATRPKYSILKNTRGPALRSWQEALDDYLKTR